MNGADVLRARRRITSPFDADPCLPCGGRLSSDKISGLKRGTYFSPAPKRCQLTTFCCQLTSYRKVSGRSYAIGLNQ